MVSGGIENEELRVKKGMENKNSFTFFVSFASLRLCVTALPEFLYTYNERQLLDQQTQLD